MVFKHTGLDERVLGSEEPQAQGSGDGGIAGETKIGTKTKKDQVKEVWAGRAGLRSHRTSRHLDVAVLVQDEKVPRPQLEWMQRTCREESSLRLCLHSEETAALKVQFERSARQASPFVVTKKGPKDMGDREESREMYLPP